MQSAACRAEHMNVQNVQTAGSGEAPFVSLCSGTERKVIQDERRRTCNVEKFPCKLFVLIINLLKHTYKAKLHIGLIIS